MTMMEGGDRPHAPWAAPPTPSQLPTAGLIARLTALPTSGIA